MSKDKTTKNDDGSVTVVREVDDAPVDDLLAIELDLAHITIERLTAHLVSKGYGHATIKRILAGEVVR